MKPKEINIVDSWVTNFARKKTPSNYASTLRGVIARKEQTIFEQDIGTKNRIVGCPVPILPNAYKAIIGAVANGLGSGYIRIHCVGHGLNTNDHCWIDGLSGIAEGNGYWPVVSKIDANFFDLVGSAVVAGHVYTAGGMMSVAPIKIVQQHPFVDSDGTTYQFIAGLDSNNKMRMYIYDSTYATATNNYSPWLELSESFTAVVDQAVALGASDKTCNIKTIQKNSTGIDIANDQLNHFLVYNLDQGNVIHCTDSSLTGSAGDHTGNIVSDIIIGSNGMNWADDNILQIYRFPCFKYNYTFDNGLTPKVNFLSVEQQRKMNILYQATDGTKHQAIQLMKRDARNYFNAITTGFASAQIIFGAPVGADLIQVSTTLTTRSFLYLTDFTDADTLKAAINFWFTDITAVNVAGTITITANDAGIGGDSYYLGLGVSNTGTMQISNTSQGASSTPNATRYFEEGTNGDPLITLPAGWYCESDFGVLNPFTLLKGSSGVPYSGAVSENIYDQTAGRAWLLSNASRSTDQTQGVDKSTQQRLAMTAKYSGYQESDPILKLFIEASDISINSPVSSNEFGISFALMNKELTSIKIYACQNNNTNVEVGWNDNDLEYVLIREINIQSSNDSGGFYIPATYAGNPNIYKFVTSSTPTYLKIRPDDIINSFSDGNPSLLAELGHYSDPNRTYPTPRYGIRLGHSQSGQIWIDQDDRVLRCCLNDGNENQDDNFPDVTTAVTVDQNDNVIEGPKLKAILLSADSILNMTTLYGSGEVHIFRKGKREIYNTQSAIVDVFDCDYAGGLISWEKGIAWMGYFGTYLLATAGYENRNIALMIQNFIDGRLKVTGDTAYVTGAYLEASIGGYDRTFNQLMWNLQLNTAAGTEYVTIAYALNQRLRDGREVGWWQRQWNIGSTVGKVVNFSFNKNDQTLTVVHQYGILRYPSDSSTYAYQDDVLVDGNGGEHSQSKGVPCIIRIELGELSSELIEMIIDKFKLGISGSSISGTGAFYIKIYGNDTLIKSYTQPIDSPSAMRGVPPKGSYKFFAIEIGLTSGTEYDFKAFGLDVIAFLYDEVSYIGNT